jgi:hypothetical protein
MVCDASAPNVLHKCTHHIEAQLVGTLLRGLPPVTDPHSDPRSRIGEILSSEVRVICQALIRVAFGSYIP